MSAFIVSKRHIDGLVTAGETYGSRYGSKFSWYWEGERHCLDSSTQDEVGAMLWAENVASVEHRYSPPGREAIYGEGWDTPDEDLPGSYKLETIAPGVAPIEVPEWLDAYRFARVPLTAVAALKAIDCYEYQSCEHDEWETSQAFAFCDALRRAICSTLPGYDAASWGLS